MYTYQDAINQIKSSISPVQAIERYTGQQARHGKYICPFHNDRNPSLSVKGSHWRCWSCNESGDVIDFTSKLFHIGFREAMQKLSDDYGLSIKLDVDPITDPLEKLWNGIERECAEHNQNEVRKYRSEIDEEIDRLTTVHRALFHNGADDALLRKYADEIDELIAYRARI